MPDLVEVAVPVGVRKTFAYSVPSRFRASVTPGMRVLVPFGRKLLTGYVVGFAEPSQAGSFRLRAIEELLEPEPAIPESLVQTALWVSRYYFAPPGEVFKALFPSGTQVSGTQRVTLTPKAANLLGGGLLPPNLSPQEHLLVELLARKRSMSVKELAACPNVRQAEAWIESLVSGGWIRLETCLAAPKVRTKQQLTVRALGAAAEAAADLPAAQKRLYAVLEHRTEAMPLQEAIRIAQSTPAAARALERRVLVGIEPARVDRTPVELSPGADCSAPVLTAAQQDLADGLLDIILRRQASRCLIHGVTGSGKTEVYLRLIAEVLKRAGGAIFLVPEIGLTPLLARLVVSRFPNLVSLLHSGMSAGERLDQWVRIRQGEARIVVGTRSAVFAPVKDLRLIVIDEEQDPSYKQDESPCYHAREVAWQRVRQSDGVLLLGSATPSVETFHSAIEKNETGFFSLPERIEARPLAPVSIVNMSREFERHGKNRVISEALERELQGCLDRGEQAIVLLNRRGYARTLLCRSCAHVFTCPDCSVSMTYHHQDNRLLCHYCGREEGVPSECTRCGGPYIHFAGVGTEQLESMLASILPKARIARLDGDTARRRGFLRTTLFNFAERKLDLLVGTQMLAKGHDFPNVTLVGVLAADAGLSFPDFRSAERTFQLLIQVAGRAGRGSAPGRVIIQSYYPEHYALQFAGSQDYRGFYDREVEFRRLMGYPPFCRLAQILVTDTDADRACRTAEKIAAMLKGQFSGADPRRQPRVLGPAPAPIERLRGQFRMQILIKLNPQSDAGPALTRCFEELGRQRVASKIHVDVDPLSVL